MNSPLAVPAGISLRRTALAVATGALLAVGSGAASAVETTFTGFSNGCFGVGCSPTASSTMSTVALDATGLTYNNSTFSGTTVSGFLALGQVGRAPPTANVNNLGSFSLAGVAAGTSFTGNAFDLLVTFTAPAGSATGAPIFTSILTGAASTTDNGGVFVDFDNTPKTFTSSAGQFTLQVNDVSLITGGTVSVTGQIRTVSAVPEPETYALFLAGLGAIGFMARRRKS